MQRRDLSKALLASLATGEPSPVPAAAATSTLDLHSALRARNAVHIPVGIHPVTSKLQTLVPNDIAGAKALGMRTCQALWFVADVVEEPEPDFRAFSQMDVLIAVSRA